MDDLGFSIDGVTIRGTAWFLTKTGRSMAWRCPGCDLTTIADEQVVDRHVGYEGQEVEVTFGEARYLCCRLCTTTVELPDDTTLVTWERFREALADDELIARTNPGLVRCESASLEAAALERAQRTLLETLAGEGAWQMRSDALAGVAFLTGVLVGVGMAMVTYVGLANSGLSPMPRKGMSALGGLVAGVIAMVVCWPIYAHFGARRHAEGVAASYRVSVQRFCRETGTSMQDLDELARTDPALKPARRVLAAVG